MWLDGRSNTRARPQENFAREMMELFTIGVGQFTESDVYAGARVFTGWNLQRIGEARDPAASISSSSTPLSTTRARRHSAFRFTPTASKTIPARAACGGMQDGVDLIAALARHPETARRLARKLWAFFVSEIRPPDEAFVNRIATVYTAERLSHRVGRARRAVVAGIRCAGEYFARYSWPVEFVARALKEVGSAGFPLNSALGPLSNMGQQLFEPPDVAGWERGTGVVFDGRDACANELRVDGDVAVSATTSRPPATGNGPTPEALLSFYLDRLSPAPFEPNAYASLLDYLRGGAAWTGNATQLRVEGARPDSSDRRLVGVSTGMKFTRRDFVRGGVSAFSLGFAAPRFLCDIALAQGAAFRNLVVLYLGGGNDSLSMLVPYRDSFYQGRRPTLAMPRDRCCRSAATRPAMSSACIRGYRACGRSSTRDGSR